MALCEKMEEGNDILHSFYLTLTEEQNYLVFWDVPQIRLIYKMYRKMFETWR